MPVIPWRLEAGKSAGKQSERDRALPASPKKAAPARRFSGSMSSITLEREVQGASGRAGVGRRRWERDEGRDFRGRGVVILSPIRNQNTMARRDFGGRKVVILSPLRSRNTGHGAISGVEKL